MGWYANRITQYHKENGLYGDDGHPSINDIHQGASGDCFFLAALGAKAARDPASIERMIATNPDGSHTVSFAKGDVHVPPLTDAEVGRGASSQGNGTWVAVVERAYADYKAQQDTAKDTDPYDTFNGGGLIEAAMAHNGATDVASYNVAGFNPNRLGALDDFRTHLTGFLDDRKLVCAISWKSPDGLPTGHAYTVTGYDSASDTICVRNPWGMVGGGYNAKVITDKGEGQFTMKMNDFLRNFSDIVVGSEAAQPAARG